MYYQTVQHYFFDLNNPIFPRRNTLFFTPRNAGPIMPHSADVLFGVQRSPSTYPLPARNTLFTINALLGNNNRNSVEYPVPVFNIPTGNQAVRQNRPYPVFVFPTTADNIRRVNALRDSAFSTAINIYGSRVFGAPPMKIDVDSTINAILSDRNISRNLGIASAQLLNGTRNNANNINAEIVDLRNLYNIIQNEVNRYFNSIPR